MISATMHEAKTQLSELVRKAQEGETVILTTGRAKTPVARLEAISPMPEKKPLGAWLNPMFVLTDAFWEPLPAEECGYGSEVE